MRWTPVLQALCSKFVPVVECRVIMDRRTGRTRGFAFVRVATPEDGQLLIQQLNGFHHRIGGVNKTLKVCPRCSQWTAASTIHPETDHAWGYQVTVALPRSQLRQASSVFFANLCDWVTEEELKIVGGQFGVIVDCRVLKGEKEGRRGGVGLRWLVRTRARPFSKVTATSHPHVRRRCFRQVQTLRFRPLSSF